MDMGGGLYDVDMGGGGGLYDVDMGGGGGGGGGGYTMWIWGAIRCGYFRLSVIV